MTAVESDRWIAFLNSQDRWVVRQREFYELSGQALVSIQLGNTQAQQVCKVVGLGYQRVPNDQTISFGYPSGTNVNLVGDGSAVPAVVREQLAIKLLDPVRIFLYGGP